MGINKKLKTALIFSIIFIFLMSFAFLVMPFASMAALAGNSLLLYITGIWFWLSLIVGYALFLGVSQNIRKIRKRQYRQLPKERPGLLRFFSNGWAAAADLVCLASLFGLFIIVRLDPLSNLVSAFLAIAIFSLQMHCILNGKNFNYILNNQEVQYSRRS